jgi:FtsP/CotA-like multicopper oxidase with cupredoxin domain
VYAGLAGFYFVRDDMDTGLPDNPLGLPAWPYEKAYAIQDRMFRDNGELFYPAFPGDPFYDEFITEAGINLGPPFFPGGGPTALAEFFGDHMVVNGVIWPKEDVEPRNYRLRLLNGCDSRFMVIRFRAVEAGATTLDDAGSPIRFHVIGSDQGLGTSAVDDNDKIDTLVFEPGGRYDVVFDFKGLQGYRIIMENVGGDAPFGGEYGDPDDYFNNRQTDRIMAFDVADMADVDDRFDVANVPGPYVNTGTSPKTRKVALFEGADEYGRLQPLLGVAEPTTDASGASENGSLSWFQPTTENPGVDDTEIWEIYNATGDAHPVHLHLVKFQILGRYALDFETEEKDQPQHSGGTGTGYTLEGVSVGVGVDPGPGYAEDAPKDMVTALPGQVTRIKATFDKPGRYVWHCHILSHEDHEMMRVLHVGPGA